MKNHPEEKNFLFVTLNSGELDGVRRVFGLTEQVDFGADILWHGGIDAVDGSCRHRVSVVRLMGRGPVPSAAGLTPILERVQPDGLILLGTAGGFASRGVNKGDVIVAEKVHFPEFGVDSLDGFHERSLNQVDPSKWLRSRARKIIDGDHPWAQNLGKRPSGSTVLPRVRAAEIATVNAVADNPNSPLLKRILSDYQKVVAVEMEAAGVARAVYEHGGHLHFISVRGISDLVDRPASRRTRKKWSPYAIAAASCFALEMIRQTVEPAKRGYLRGRIDPPGRRAVREVRVQQDSAEPMEHYLASLSASLERDKPAYDFRVVCSSLTSQTPMTPPKIRSELEYNERILLWGKAGIGKTSVIHALAREIIRTNSGWIPVLLDLKNINSELSEEIHNSMDPSMPFTEQMDVLLKMSVKDVTAQDLIKWNPQRVVLLVDGVNEVFGKELVKHLLRTVNTWVRENGSRHRAVLSDRRGSRSSYERWHRLQVMDLPSSEVRRQVELQGLGAAYNELRDGSLEMLRTPYYLSHALRERALDVGSEADAHQSYFVNQLGLTASMLSQISRVAFEGYARHGSLTLPRSIRDMTANPELAQAIRILLDGGAIEQVGATSEYRFDHQLKHDFFAASYLVNRPKAWTSDAFDSLTLQSNSFDALTLAIQLLPSEDQSDDFLRSVYNWNWVASTHCLSAAPEACSIELQFAILGLLALKVFDPIMTTARRARQLLAESQSEVAPLFRTLEDRNQVRSLVAEWKGGESVWFEEWRRVFVAERDELNTPFLSLLVDGDPLTGWTAANSLRVMGALPREVAATLQGIYLGNEEQSVRWRVVHVLGGFDELQVIDFLSSALVDEKHMWVRYGIVRSLVEIAARNGGGLCQEASTRLRPLLSELGPKVQTEIYRAAQYYGYHIDWPGTAIDLVEEIARNVPPELDEKWRRRVGRIREIFAKDDFGGSA